MKNIEVLNKYPFMLSVLTCKWNGFWSPDKNFPRIPSTNKNNRNKKRIKQQIFESSDVKKEEKYIKKKWKWGEESREEKRESIYIYIYP